MHLEETIWRDALWEEENHAKNAMKPTTRFRYKRRYSRAIDRFIEEHEINDGQDREYLLNVVNGVIDKEMELDCLISNYAEGGP